MAEPQKYLTAPVPSDKMPTGIPYIVGNEAAERFSFYGMKAILVAFMTTYLLEYGTGRRSPMPDQEAQYYYHLFVMSAYFFPLLGAIISDTIWGKYRTIMILSVVYCLGHLALAVDESRVGLFAGLLLVALGSGGIKPCVSAHVGDQFGERNKHLLPKVFGWFYFAINFGAFLSTLLTPLLLQKYGPSVAFGVPGVLMALATLVFWMGRNHFVHIPPSGVRAVKNMLLSPEGLGAIRNLLVIYAFVAVFWSLYDQTGAAWVLQAERMDREILGMTLLSSQFQAINPLLILILSPLFAYVIYPLINKVYRLNELRKIGIGLFVIVIGFSISAWAESLINGGAVLTSNSEADPDAFGRNKILDGNPDTGWASGPFPVPQDDAETSESIQADEPQPPELVIRLRERKAWPVSAVVINPEINLEPVLLAAKQAEAEKQNLDPQSVSVTPEEVAACRPKTVEILAGDTPRGNRVESGGEAEFTWTSLAKADLSPEGQDQTIEFEPVTTEYLKVVVHSSHGGPQTGLAEVKVITDTPEAMQTVPEEDIGSDVAAIGYRPGISWQVWAYFFLTAAEVMVSITGLEFSYTQAPKEMKSFVMALWLLAVAAGNAIAAAVNLVIMKDDGSSRMDGPAYYWFFTGLMLVAAFLYIGVARTYRGKTYIQGSEPATTE